MTLVDRLGSGSLVAAAPSSDQSKGHHEAGKADADDRTGDGIYAEQLDIAGSAERNVAN